MTGIFAALLTTALSNLAAQPDHRIVQIPYNPDKIVVIYGHRLVQTMIEFNADEHIENIAVGNSSSWQITPNKRSNIIFLKPMMRATRTNMTVVTDKRSYIFVIINHYKESELYYVVRFSYPERSVLLPVVAVDAPDKASVAVSSPVTPPMPEHINWRAIGDQALIPAEVYDDGTVTYVAWNAKVDFPAIFAKGSDGSEAPVNFRLRNGTIIIDGVASRYILRIGKTSATLIRPVAVPAKEARP